MSLPTIGSSTDNALARWNGAGGTAVQDSNAILDDTGNVTFEGTIQGATQGATKAFQVATADFVGGPNKRCMLHFCKTNDPDFDNSGGTYAGDGPVITIGAGSADGWPGNIITEGAIFWGQNSNGGTMDHTNYGYARIKPLRFQLLNTIGGTQYNLFRVDTSQFRYRPANDLTQDLVNINPTNGVEINYGGLYLPTTGGTASNLNYYEDSESSISITGPFNKTPSAQMHLSRVGKNITMGISEVKIQAGNTAGLITLPSLALRFRPRHKITMLISVENNTIDGIGILEITNKGEITIYKDINKSLFGTSGINGFAGFSVSYQTSQV